ncbi:acetyl-CoA carboxylase biotin carboxyl carrier protein [Sphingobacteriaceae bacterium AH-315-L07]|nr:acetyl-CoA carboxylase biotin carboxyl carrier protein [Sphingobacteriaceae bacterium AH-315-L07]
MNLKQIQDLIKFVSQSGVSEVEIEREGFKLKIKTPNGASASPEVHVENVAAAPAQKTVASSPTPPAVPKSVESSTESTSSDGLVEIKSPMIGTFYRRPSPDKDLFVNVGDNIEEGQVICIIEAMKLFNEIEAEVSGKVIKILVEDSTPVEYDQPLLLIDPS